MSALATLPDPYEVHAYSATDGWFIQGTYDRGEALETARLLVSVKGGDILHANVRDVRSTAAVASYDRESAK